MVLLERIELSYSECHAVARVSRAFGGAEPVVENGWGFMVPPTGVTSNSFPNANSLPCENLSAVFEELQNWEEVLSASGFEPEELQP